MLDLIEWQKKKYTTKEGNPIRILCIDGPGSWPIVGAEGENLRRWSKDGIYDLNGRPSVYDLINAKTKFREGWVQLSKGSGNNCPLAYTTHVYATAEEAMAFGGGSIPPIKIEWEE